MLGLASLADFFCFLCFVVLLWGRDTGGSGLLVFSFYGFWLEAWSTCVRVQGAEGRVLAPPALLGGFQVIYRLR